MKRGFVMSNSDHHATEAHGPSIQGAATRRAFLQGSLATAGTALASPLAPIALSARTEANRPNLVFFLGEGQRADALSIAGNPILNTPNQDRIGREGLRFENAFCTNALCAPARATELTGMYSRSTGALSNAHLNVPLPSDIPLFTDLLHEAGYEVAILGKVHLQNGGEERYWDYYFGHNDPPTTTPILFSKRAGRVRSAPKNNISMFIRTI
jgi:hypothetical protein